jgi:hypothetical protein
MTMKKNRDCTMCKQYYPIAKDLIHNETGEIILEKGTPICRLHYYMVSDPKSICKEFSFELTHTMGRPIPSTSLKRVFEVAFGKAVNCGDCIFAGPECVPDEGDDGSPCTGFIKKGE